MHILPSKLLHYAVLGWGEAPSREIQCRSHCLREELERMSCLQKAHASRPRLVPAVCHVFAASEVTAHRSPASRAHLPPHPRNFPAHPHPRDFPAHPHSHPAYPHFHSSLLQPSVFFPILSTCVSDDCV
ncbi:Hypothetical protein NTJ_02633 [Nesidiocoris tenuis]|uniref:Uncharacterized protein n=1 Tax=Nesidiocoris tenuis TaxID=355587 RepID=A0ABN7AC40_9HEMI|nr:Hypothetical protein NTJ_02633 [Nesidiocoris tenuis]